MNWSLRQMQCAITIDIDAVSGVIALRLLFAPGKFFMLCRLLIFFQNLLFQKFFQEYHLSVNRLDPDQVRHFVRSELGPICLQRL